MVKPVRTWVLLSMVAGVACAASEDIPAELEETVEAPGFVLDIEISGDATFLSDFVFLLDGGPLPPTSVSGLGGGTAYKLHLTDVSADALILAGRSITVQHVDGTVIATLPAVPTYCVGIGRPPYTSETAQSSSSRGRRDRSCGSAAINA